MGKELQKKASFVFAPRVPSAVGTDDAAAKPKTAIGGMVQFTERQSTAVKEAEQLREQLKRFEGSLPVRKIRPNQIVRSKWANRHTLSFADQDFESLKADIDAHGGNVQPIKVRPSPNDPERFELVYGHRRHQACMELQIEVLAIVEDLDDKMLFVQMDRENRERKNLSPYELGAMYANALAQGLFPSVRRLAEEVSIDQSQLNKALTLARLPSDVIQAFVSPLDLQYRWASEITAALQRDPEKVLRVAKEIQVTVPRPAAAVVLKRLTEDVAPSVKSTDLPVHIAGAAGKEVRLTFDAKNQTVRAIFPQMPLADFERLQFVLRDFLSTKAQ